MKPTANFKVNPQGLSVSFTDSSSGVPSSWAWNFGFSVDGDPQTSTEQNPTVVFPDSGLYLISLIATNGDGNSDPLLLNIIVNEFPTLMLTIEDMIRYEVPAQIEMSQLGMQNLIQKWQLWLQPFTKPSPIADINVFNQAAWPPICNVLISKLVVYDLIMRAATSAMTAYGATMQVFGKVDPTITTYVSVADFYSDTFPVGDLQSGDTITVESYRVNSQTIQWGNTFESWDEVVGALTGDGHGVMYYREVDGGTQLYSLSTNDIIQSLILQYNDEDSIEIEFVQENTRVATANQTVTIEASVPDSLPGPIKKLETGPSNTEWYDSSTFWRSMFTTAPGANNPETGFSGGIMQNLSKEICSMAARLGIRLPMCKTIMPVNVPIFKNTRLMGGLQSDTCLTYWPDYWPLAPDANIWAWDIPYLTSLYRR